MNRIKQIIIYPVLLALYPVLFIYSHNMGQVYFKDVILPMFTILFPVAVGWLLLSKWLKDGHRSALIISIGVFLFFSYGHVAQNFSGRWREIFLPLLWSEIFLISLFFVVRSKRSFHKISYVLNVFSSILVVLCVFSIASFSISTARVKHSNDGFDFQSNLGSTDDKEPTLDRDIYFIVLDAYGRADVLKEMYDYDNSCFLNELRAKGFYVADSAVSNYNQTGLSLGSCLNLSYLDDFVQKIGQQSTSRLPLKALIEESLFVEFLRDRGYRTVAFDTYCPLTGFNSADLHLSTGDSLNPFYESLKNMTPLPYFSKIDSVSKYRENILYIIDSLSKIAELSEKPKFVFAHIELPHPPFVFGPAGEYISYEKRFDGYDGDWLIKPGRLNKSQYMKGFTDQITFVNARIEKVIDDIIKKTSPKPVIVLLSDHGPRSELIWEDPQKSNVKEAHSILSAYYLPGKDNALLYPEISPVNTFRVISNLYFGKDDPLLQDKCYYSTARQLYKFYDVTDRVTDQ